MRAGLCRLGSDELRAGSANLIERTQSSDEHQSLMFTLFMLKQLAKMLPHQHVLAQNDTTVRYPMPSARNSMLKTLVSANSKFHRGDMRRDRRPEYAVTLVRRWPDALSKRLKMIFEPVIVKWSVSFLSGRADSFFYVAPLLLRQMIRCCPVLV